MEPFDIRDLGILFDSSLNFIDPLNKIRTDSIKRLGFIVKNCYVFTSTIALDVLYFSYVRSKLEYGAIIWNPYYQVHKEALEKVQRRFLKFRVYKQTGHYPERGYDHSALLNMCN